MIFPHIEKPDQEKDQHRTEDKQPLGIAEKNLHDLRFQGKLERLSRIGICQKTPRLNFPVGKLQADRSRKACGIDQKPQRVEYLLQPIPVTFPPEAKKQIDKDDNHIRVPDQKNKTEADPQQKTVTVAGQIFPAQYKPEKKSDCRKCVSVGIACIFRRVDRKHRPEIDAAAYNYCGHSVIVELQDPI